MTERLWQIAILTTTAALAFCSKAEAAIYYWQDSGASTSQATHADPPRHPKARRQTDKKAAVAETEAGKPQGPLIISISIAQQRLRVYDANGLFAQTPISTGMPGHSTPMGVFSIIQKQKFHRSNIYSNAPMPYMQRITWSGVAIHAGVLPGYPASHGCIRMPPAFAVKMYGWTKMGARVVVTPGELSPTSFSHPLLATLRLPPQPVVEEAKPEASAEPQPAIEIQASPAADAAKPKIELRPGIDPAKPAASEPQISAPAQSRISKATDAAPTANPEKANPVDKASHTATDSAATPAPAAEAAVSNQENIGKVTGEGEALKAETGPSVAANASSDNKAVDTAPAEAKPSDASIADAKAEATTAEVAVSRQVEASKKTKERVEEKPADANRTTATPATPPAVAAPSGDVPKTAAPKADPQPLSRRAGQIAVFVSRKDSKLYVRQNFSPLFSVPISIAPDERPLGTHIFTAQVDKNDSNVLHWSVVSLPTPSHHGEEPRRRKIAGAGPIEVKAMPVPDDPTEALDRLTLPADVMARIFEGISSGGSIIVSDQGIAAGETGEGTDFIVSLR